MAIRVLRVANATDSTVLNPASRNLFMSAPLIALPSSLAIGIGPTISVEAVAVEVSA